MHHSSRHILISCVQKTSNLECVSSDMGGSQLKLMRFRFYAQRVWHRIWRLLSLRACNSTAYAFLAAWEQIHMGYSMANPGSWE